jgi:restriction system protein
LDDFIEVVALLPWWAGVALAVLSYGVLHWYANIPVPVASTPSQMGGIAFNVVFKGFAFAGQYIAPILCLAGALFSWIGRARRRALVAGVAESDSAHVLHGMTWQEFEMLVAEAFRLEGYTVTERTQGGADGGVDLVLRKAGEKTLVQCKHWRVQKVGVTILRELYGVMAAHGAAGGIVVTAGQFTDDALAFAKGRKLRLISGENLFALIRRAQRSVPTAPSQPITNEPSLASADPACPKCGSAMARRTAKRGSHAGKQFWGCLAFPKCTGIREVG